MRIGVSNGRKVILLVAAFALVCLPVIWVSCSAPRLSDYSGDDVYLMTQETEGEILEIGYSDTGDFEYIRVESDGVRYRFMFGREPAYEREAFKAASPMPGDIVRVSHRYVDERTGWVVDIEYIRLIAHGDAAG